METARKTGLPGAVEECLKRAHEKYLAAWLGDTWELVRATDANLMVVGSADVTGRLVNAFGGWRRKLLVDARPDQSLVLPLSGQVEAMVVRDVTRLTLADQHRLVEWMDERGASTQVISTAPAAVTPLVHAGAFLETLYYRLNVLYVELHA